MRFKVGGNRTRRTGFPPIMPDTHKLTAKGYPVSVSSRQTVIKGELPGEHARADHCR